MTLGRTSIALSLALTMTVGLARADQPTAPPAPPASPGAVASPGAATAPGATVTATTSGGVADDASKERALGLLREGNDLFRRGDSSGALEKFEAALAAYPSAKLHFNIAQAQARLGRKDDAMRSYERFLSEAQDAPRANRTAAQKAVAALEPELAILDVGCNIAGADILVDGRVVTTSPVDRPVWVLPGEHTVSARKDGFSQPVLIRDVKAGQRAIAELRLDPFVAEAAAAPPGAAPSGVPAATAATAAPTAAQPAPNAGLVRPGPAAGGAAPTRPLRRWAVVSAVGAGVLGAGGLVTGVLMKMRYDDLRETCGSGATGWPGCSDDDISGVRTRRNLANVMLVGAAAAAVTSGVLFYLDGQAVEGRVAATPDGAVLLAGGRF